MEKTKHIMLFAGARVRKNASKMWGWITGCFIRLIALQMQRKLLSILHFIFGKCGLLDHLALWIFNSAESTHTAIIRWFQAKAISGTLYGRASTLPGSPHHHHLAFCPHPKIEWRPPLPVSGLCTVFQAAGQTSPHWCFETGGCINTA